MNPRTKKGDSDKLDFKRKLRSEMTDPERRMWNKLRACQLGGLGFRRQHGIGPYIVDFFCPEKKMIIEIDGETHAEEKQMAKDVKKEAYFDSLGLKVVRYLNREIMENLEGVIEDLYQKMNTSPL